MAGSFNQAVSCYLKAVKMDANFAEAWNNMGNAFGQMREYTNAIECFDNALVIDPIYERALYGKAGTLKNMGKRQEALSTVDRLLELTNNVHVVILRQSLI